jgi:hypothetical protein
MPQGVGCEELRLTDLSQKDLVARGRPIIDEAEKALQKLAMLMVDSARAAQ